MVVGCVVATMFAVIGTATDRPSSSVVMLGVVTPGAILGNKVTLIGRAVAVAPIMARGGVVVVSRVILFVVVPVRVWCRVTVTSASRAVALWQGMVVAVVLSAALFEKLVLGAKVDGRAVAAATLVVVRERDWTRTRERGHCAFTPRRSLIQSGRQRKAGMHRQKVRSRVLHSSAQRCRPERCLGPLGGCRQQGGRREGGMGGEREEVPFSFSG